MTHQVKITFYPVNVKGCVPKGITILEAARMLGVDMEGPCGGAGRCGKDLVQVRINNRLHTALACKTPIEADMVVFIPHHEKGTAKILDGFYGANKKGYDINPSVRKEVTDSDEETCATKVYVNDEYFSTERGDTRSLTYGVALDIGTTTLAAALVDLNNGKIVGRASALNPLVYYGHDVMSRIKYSTSHAAGLSQMHRELISAVNYLIRVLSTESGVNKEAMYQVVAAGNTTMQHIFLNKGIEGIGEYPYKAEVLDIYTTHAEALAIDAAGSAPITTFPCISGYVGGDIVSGLLAIGMEAIELPAIFLDIGTNGEMALLLKNKMLATSTAAGPCFEGMTISCGMRACEGAIEHVSFHEAVSLDVIGCGAPRGICGSGLLDLTSELIRTGLVNFRGRLQGSACVSAAKYGKHLVEKEGKRYFHLTGELFISQEDIRQVQLAKAAIRSGVEVLLATENIKAQEVKTVIIAGAFGYHLNKDSLFGVGILPEIAYAEIFFVGNSSLEGAVKMLLNKELKQRAIQIARAVQSVELSQIQGFEDIFVSEMSFCPPKP